MGKLGYTWYPKDWGNSESVFELNLSERGLYRELIDLAMLNDNRTEIKMDVWSRKFNIETDSLKSILSKLILLNLIVIKTESNFEIIFIPSCESRLNLVRGGSNGGKKSKPIPKPIPKPIESLEEKKEKPIANQIESKIEIKDIIEKKKINFIEAMKPHKQNYTSQMLNDFYDYWTETKPNSKLIRWEREKAFDMVRRLDYWSRNENKFKQPIKQDRL